MKYRVLSPEGDYVFGRGTSQFLTNTPETVAQAVRTRLLLALGEWFLDMMEGTPYRTRILGNNTMALYDQAIQQRILETQGVTGIESYFSTLSQERQLSVSARINTVYGPVQLQQVL